MKEFKAGDIVILRGSRERFEVVQRLSKGVLIVQRMTTGITWVQWELCFDEALTPTA